jgi:ABC-type sugar transport system ATPase subunit
MMSSAILECADITKSFGGIPVLKGVTLHLEPGTVTALAGENGAGKSTLMKIVSGQYSADSGDVSVEGSHLTPGSPRDAVRHGVAIVPQELASIEDMTVYENLFVGRELKRGPFLNRRAMIAEARKTLSAFDVAISPTARMGSLPVGLRQIVEIVKAARTGAQVVMLDEPTSAISEREVEGLYGIVRQLRDHGVAMVYTTHKMAEIRAIADRVVRGKARTTAVSEVMESVRLRSSGMGQLVGTLSGGNQQKVVLARWLTGEVNVLLLDEPARGVDVGARSEIYRIITEFAGAGMAVVMASSDMPEIIGLSHRAFVMRNGAFVGELDRDALDHPSVQESVFRMATALDGPTCTGNLAPNSSTAEDRPDSTEATS